MEIVFGFIFIGILMCCLTYGSRRQERLYKEMREQEKISSQQYEDRKQESRARMAGFSAFTDYLHAQAFEKKHGFTPLIMDPVMHLGAGIYHVIHLPTAKYHGKDGYDKLKKIMYDEIEKLKNLPQFKQND